MSWADLAFETDISILWDVATRAAAAEDYGRLVHGSAQAVAYPRSPEEVEHLLAVANRDGLRLTLRGQGHSTGGQSVPADSIVLDFSRLDHLGPLDEAARTITCGPGTRWRSVLAATARRGLVPHVLPQYLDLSVGGLLGMGGIGTTCHRYGPAVANVLELDVVTGEGRRMRCGFDRERDLLDATLANLGRCAAIVSATLPLRPVKSRLRVFFLLYDDVETWLADHRAMRDAGHFDHLEGFCSSSAQGTRRGLYGREPFMHWFYGIHAAIEYEPGREPDDAALLTGLRPYRVVHVEDDDPLGYAARFDGRRERALRTGADARMHPWLDALLPVHVLPGVLPRLLDGLPPTLGDGHRVILMAARDVPRFFAVPPGDEIACLSILPRGVSPSVAGNVIDVIRAVHDTIVQAGGKRYLPGWLGMMDAAAWRGHYGADYDAWLDAKRRFDPRGVFTSALWTELGL